MADVDTLLEGYKSFYQRYFESNDPLFKQLSQGQSPKTLVVACSDSRVDPSIVMDAKPGDMFVIRNVANLVPPYDDSGSGYHGVSAALEFAVRVLNVEHIVVMGHSGCAGIATLIDPSGVKDTDFIGEWVGIASDARAKTFEVVVDDASADQIQHTCEQQGVLHSLANLMTFPWIASQVQEGKLQLHGWHFSIKDGRLMRYDPASAKFVC